MHVSLLILACRSLWTGRRSQSSHLSRLCSPLRPGR